jgi:hypothetical protein
LSREALAFLVAHVGNHDLSASCNDRADDCLAESSGATSYECKLAVEPRAIRIRVFVQGGFLIGRKGS